MDKKNQKGKNLIMSGTRSNAICRILNVEILRTEKLGRAHWHCFSRDSAIVQCFSDIFRSPLGGERELCPLSASVELEDERILCKGTFSILPFASETSASLCESLEASLEMSALRRVGSC